MPSVIQGLDCFPKGVCLNSSVPLHSSASVASQLLEDRMPQLGFSQLSCPQTSVGPQGPQKTLQLHFCCLLPFVYNSCYSVKALGTDSRQWRLRWRVGSLQDSNHHGRQHSHILLYHIIYFFILTLFSLKLISPSTPPRIQADLVSSLLFQEKLLTSWVLVY